MRIPDVAILIYKLLHFINAVEGRTFSTSVSRSAEVCA
jgi:hypothetical protein